MRRHTSLALALALSASGLIAQEPPPSVEGATPSSSPQAASTQPSERLERALVLRDDSPWLDLPTAEGSTGSLEIPAGERRAGPVVVADGTLDVYGTIAGDAVAYAGDIVVHSGGRIEGRAVALLGDVRLESGAMVTGEIVTLRGAAIPAAALPASPGERTRQALLLVLGWMALVIPIGVGVLVFARSHLDAVTETLVRSVGRSFAIGLLGQIALIPALLLLIVGLAVTLIGILLIPIAVVAYVVAAAGLLMLGFLAAARLVGGAATRRATTEEPEATRRRRALRALLVGIAVLFVPWLLAAALTSVPAVGGLLHLVAMLFTWVAVTAGFGAAIRSRAGRRRVDGTTVEPADEEPEDDLSWQTPTPVGGVVAARRPTPVSSGREVS